ncbi:MAG: bifunctional phosphoribosyl-AMP cyclohydrolase/phosphoribosyl-ATP diphosphatase HisIE [Alphaproteobacteria bacterium]
MTANYAKFDGSKIDWDKSSDGLVPAIAQDARTLRVLMLGYVNRESLQATIATGLVTFFSRSKQRLWQKGETSGHVLRLHDIKHDCDNDTLLMLVTPDGPTCHLGTQSCFGDGGLPSLSTLADLAATIHMRYLLPEAGSYTAKLFEDGIARIAQKVGEEAVETAIAATTKNTNLPYEAADLLYHLLVLLEATGTDWMDVVEILHERAQARKK